MGTYEGSRADRRPRVSDAEAKAARRAEGAAKAAAAIERLDGELTRLASDDAAFAEYLRLSGRMHRYSWGNRLLIMLQRPDTRMVAGFHRWRELGRPVLKGSKGIQILAPMTGKREDETTGETVVFTRGFRVTYVFAVEDTDGPRIGLPTPIELAEPDSPAAIAAADRIIAAAAELGVGCELVSGPEWGDGVTGPAGRCYLAERRFVVNGELAGLPRAKTAAHELAHAIAGHLELGDDRRDMEAIAEGSAFVVLAELGFDTSSWSAPYVAGWASDDLGRLRRLLDRIAKVSGDILRAIDATGSCITCGWNGEGEGGCERCR